MEKQESRYFEQQNCWYNFDMRNFYRGNYPCKEFLKICI